MRSLPLTADDVLEMLSSLLMPGMTYADRMAFSKGASLEPHFVPSAEVLPELERYTTMARTMFGVPEVGLARDSTLRDWADEIHAGWMDTDRTITFLTSGSTGAPKPTAHEYVLLEQEVNAQANLYKGRRKIVGFVPRNHIYGFLFTILLPKSLDVPVQWEAPLPTTGLIRILEPGDLVVAFPLLWGKFWQMNAAFGPDVYGVTSTAPCPTETIYGLRANGLARMYEIYGSSETGGVGYRTTPDGEYTLLPYWRRTSTSSLLVRSLPRQGEREYLLQDVLHWKDGRFTPRRRADNAVQVAGMNVYPARIRDMLAEHPGVADCLVRLMRQEEGDRLKAFVVPTKDQDVSHLESELRVWARQHLQPTEQPAKWTFGNRIPIGAMGKAKDW